MSGLRSDSAGPLPGARTIASAAEQSPAKTLADDSVVAIAQARSAWPAQIFVSSRYENEPWQLFVALIGHELQHTQSEVSPADEAITNFELAIEFAELLAKHPQLAYLNTELARRLNGFVELFLNSRHPGSAQNVIIAPDGLGLAPGSTNSYVDWWGDYTDGHGIPGSSSAPPVEGEAVLGSLLPGVKLPNPLNYDQTTAGLFSHMADPYLIPAVRLRISVLLQLMSVSQIAAKLGITSAKAISTFGLRPQPVPGDRAAEHSLEHAHRLADRRLADAVVGELRREPLERQRRDLAQLEVAEARVDMDVPDALVGVERRDREMSAGMQLPPLGGEVGQPVGARVECG
jgi:hypothetical protein